MNPGTRVLSKQSGLDRLKDNMTSKLNYLILIRKTE
jgi:hypothetical protein